MSKKSNHKFTGQVGFERLCSLRLSMNNYLGWQKLSLAVLLGALNAVSVATAEKFVPPARPIPLAPEYNSATPPAPPALPQQTQVSVAPAPQPQPVAPRLVQSPKTGPLVHQNGSAPIPLTISNPPQPTAPAQPASYLAYDSESKEYNAKVGDTNAHFTFWLTNVSKEVVAINSVRTSCGCTVAQLPETPWKLAPGTNGPIEVSVNLLGKSGTIVKSVTVDSTAGGKSLLVKVNIPSPANTAVAANSAPNSGDVERIKNMQSAMGDRQVVFKNKDCAKCHADPAVDKNGLAVMGESLYKGVCANCHDSPQRASLVPDLKDSRRPTHPRSHEDWRRWIASGRVGSMMPAFSKTEGGPLTDAQVNSLVEYLSSSMPNTTVPATAQPVLKDTKPKQSASAK
jgi:mono/diheme cytochrome c family protein